MSNSKKTHKMVQLAIFSAIIVVLSFIAIKFGAIEITLVPIPVAIGAIMLGKKYGAFLGGVFGIISFIQCFGYSAFGAFLLQINPIFTLIVCLVPRVCAGFLSGLIFELLKKIDKTKVMSFALASLASALFNTLIFVGGMVLLFFNNETFAETFNSGGLNPVAFMIAFIGINGIVEAVTTTVIGGTVSKSVYHVVNKARR